MVRPRPSARRRISLGESGQVIRSFSNSSIPSNPAVAAADIFSGRVPLRETVAMDLRMERLHYVRTSSFIKRTRRRRCPGSGAAGAGQVGDDRLADHGPVPGTFAGRDEVPVEQGAPGVLVGDVEDA